MKKQLTILFLLLFSVSFAQSIKIVGNVKDDSYEPIPGARIKVIGDDDAVYTDIHGNFEVYTSKPLPVVLDISSTGFEFNKVKVTSKNKKVEVVLKSEDVRLNEIIVSASRTPEKIRESPVTVERLSIKDIRKSASLSFYDSFENMKEVQMNTCSMVFKSINTRGFANTGNNRFLQLIDGVDNSSSSLNFVFGNILGVSEIDVQNVELLPGPSSALYGANAFNGIIFINTQNPFKLQGITAYAKFGTTHQASAGSNQYYDYGIRAAKAFSKHFAAKANFSFLRGTDWHATNYADVNNPSLTRDYKNYDGVNVYGDEVTISLPSGIGSVSRTGYNEVDLTENIAKNAKIDFSLHLKPFSNDIEMIWQSKFGFGNSVHQGANRYNLNNFFMQQHGLEIRGKNFFVRGYHNDEFAGNSYDMKFAAWNVNRAWKSDATWFNQYATRYLQAMGGAFGPAYFNNPTASHPFARAFADTGRLIPGTAAFKTAFKKVIDDPNSKTGARLVDNCSVNHVDANYNFKDILSFAEIQLGGSLIERTLDSEGRIYTDYTEPIIYKEYGMYLQSQKKMIDDKLKLTASVRYDKSQNFNGNFSPRVSAVYAAGAKQNHIFRASFQTGFRNPSTQDQYIGFNIGSAVLLGSAQENLTRYSESIVLSGAGAGILGSPTVTIDGNNAYYNSYTSASVVAFAGAVGTMGITNASGLLQKSKSGLVVPELVKSIDLGYRTKVLGIFLDVNGYYNQYTNFIGSKFVVAPLYGKATDGGNFLPATEAFKSAQALINSDRRTFGIYTNTDIEIKSYGFGLGANKKLTSNYELGVNYNFAKFEYDQSHDPSFVAGFNTPQHRVKASLLGEKVIGNLGFNINYRWADSYLYESSFANGMIDAASVIDAQVNYTFPKAKSTFKIGGTNLGGKDYFTVFGAGAIGQQYFVSWTLNP